MTYGELKNRVMQLVFSHSKAGTVIDPTYNDQADYIRMIPGLLSSIQAEIYQLKVIEGSVKLCDLDKEDQGNGETLYHLPDDCLKMKPGLIIPRAHMRHRYGHRPIERFGNYRLFGGDKFFAPSNLPDNTILEYQRKSLPVPENVTDSYVLKNPDDINEIIPFYIAAWLVLYDDPFRYAALYNEFETRLSRIKPAPAYTEDNPILDCYGGFDPAWFGGGF